MIVSHEICFSVHFSTGPDVFTANDDKECCM